MTLSDSQDSHEIVRARRVHGSTHPVAHMRESVAENYADDFPARVVNAQIELYFTLLSSSLFVSDHPNHIRFINFYETHILSWVGWWWPAGGLDTHRLALPAYQSTGTLSTAV